VKRLSIALVLLLAACSADLTLPPKIDGIVPPVPGDFQVSTTDAVTYDLSWTISDPTVVSFYRLYVVVGGSPELVDTTQATRRHDAGDVGPGQHDVPYPRHHFWGHIGEYGQYRGRSRLRRRRVIFRCRIPTLIFYSHLDGSLEALVYASLRWYGPCYAVRRGR
jgi:hypothetical protein